MGSCVPRAACATGPCARSRASAGMKVVIGAASLLDGFRFELELDAGLVVGEAAVLVAREPHQGAFRIGYNDGEGLLARVAEALDVLALLLRRGAHLEAQRERARAGFAGPLGDRELVVGHGLVPRVPDRAAVEAHLGVPDDVVGRRLPAQ